MKFYASEAPVRQNGLKHLGLENLGRTYWDLSPAGAAARTAPANASNSDSLAPWLKPFFLAL